MYLYQPGNFIAFKVWVACFRTAMHSASDRLLEGGGGYSYVTIPVIEMIAFILDLHLPLMILCNKLLLLSGLTPIMLSRIILGAQFIWFSG